MTSEEIADVIEAIHALAALRGCNPANDPGDVALIQAIQAKMLGEIAYQLAVANERAAPPGDPGAAYFEYSPSGLPVRKPL